MDTRLMLHNSIIHNLTYETTQFTRHSSFYNELSHQIYRIFDSFKDSLLIKTSTNIMHEFKKK